MMDIEQTLQQAINLHVSGNLDDAEALYRHVLSVQPDQPDAIHFLGVLAYNRGNLELAKKYIQKAIELVPDNAGCYTNMGNVFQKEKNYGEAIKWYGKGIDLNPDNKMAYCNLGVAYTKLDRLDDAKDVLKNAIRIDPSYTEAYANLCETYKFRGEYVKAQECCIQALRIDPEHVQTHWNQSILMLLQGDFKRGFKAYEWRWKRQNTLVRSIDSGERWTGQPLQGKTIFVYEEQGLGDTIQFMRYLPFIRNLGGKVILEVLSPLVRLVENFRGFDRLWVARRSVDTRAVDRFDYHVPMMSLPGLFQTTLETVPAETSYLKADPGLSAVWRRRIGSGNAFKIGVVWAGSPDHNNDRNRSVLLSRFKPIRDMENVMMFSLQKDKYEKWTDLDPSVLFQKDLGEEIGDFADTAAIIDNLDLVITVDTSVAHLAGAMGKKTWILLPFYPDWRWLLDREDTPWYPSMRLFRQPDHGEWGTVIERVTSELRKSLP